MDSGWASVLKCTWSVSEGSVRVSVSVSEGSVSEGSVRVCVTNVSVRVSAIGSGSVRVCVCEGCGVGWCVSESRVWWSVSESSVR